MMVKIVDVLDDVCSPCVKERIFIDPPELTYRVVTIFDTRGKELVMAVGWDSEEVKLEKSLYSHFNVVNLRDPREYGEASR